MKRRNATRSALFTSIISLLLCVSMLVGTTFAWFTDSVTSGVNTIAAGNLDVDVYTADGNSIQNQASLFNEITYWEPGVVAYENLTVKNEGSLALKYQMKVNFTNVSAAKNGKTLADALKVAVVKGGVSGYTNDNAGRAKLVTDLKDDWQSLASFVQSGKLLPENYAGEAVEGAADVSEVYGLVIYWQPTADDNDFNMNNGDRETKLTIDLGVALFATQLEAENDSFGDEYDKEAEEDVWVDGFDVHNENELQAAIDAGQTNIDVMNDIELTETLVIPASATSTFSLRSSGIVINLNGKTITGEMHKSVGAIIKNAGNLILKNGTVSSVGNNGGSALANSGVAVLENVILNGAPNADGSWPAYTVNNTGVLEATNTKFTSYHGAVASYSEGALVTLNNCEIDMKGIPGFTNHGIYTYEKGEVVINGGTYVNHAADQNSTGGSVINGAVTVNGGTFSGRIEKYSGTPVIKGGTFSVKFNANYVAEGYKVVQGENGESVVIPADRNYVADGVQVDEDGNYYIANLAGWKWLDAQADNFFGNKTIKLTANIDFGGETVTGIKFWNSHPTFDGQEYTLSNYVVAHSGTKSPSGLFSGTFDVMNLVIDNAKVTGDYAGAIAGNMYGNVTNCVVKNSTITSTYWQAGALVGQYNAGNIIGCDVENCTISGGSAVGGLIGILNETEGTRKVENCTVTNCAIVKDGGFGGNYDKMFGIVTGLVNIENSTVEISGTYENNTVKGVVSDSLCGTVADGTKVYVISTADNGMELLEETTSGTVSLYNTAGYTGTTLEVPEGIQAIGNYAFAYNNTIETVVLPSTVTDLGRGFDSSTVKMVVLNEGLETISSRAFRSTTALEKVVISSTVEEIADNAFQKSGIKEIVIPDNVETIGEAAFGSSKIEKVTIEGNTSIQGYAFRGCTNLREVHLLGDNVTFIASTLNGRNSTWFCNGESNNPNTSNITFYVVNETVAARVKAAMGAEAANTPVYVVNGDLYEG